MQHIASADESVVLDTSDCLIQQRSVRSVWNAAARCLHMCYVLDHAFAVSPSTASGSSTACVLVVNGTTLSASNLGDSGFLLVRDGVAFFQCPQQQHNFNFPFQLGSADSMSDQPQAAMVSVCYSVIETACNWTSYQCLYTSSALLDMMHDV